MYPPERRARGIAYVLFGSVFGAILGPAVFAPLFAGKQLEPEALTLPWLVAAGLALVACAISLCIRPDPKRIAEQLGTHAGAPPPTAAAPLSEILRRPGVVPAMIAAVASLAVMASVMNLTGYVVVEHHHQSQEDVFPIIGAHVLGMYALVLFVGPLIDRIGRGVSLYSGLVLMAFSCIGLTWFESVLGTAVLLFGLGLGWNLSFVAATAQLADRAAPAERGKLLGFSDLLSAMTAAALALLGGARAGRPRGVGAGHRLHRFGAPAAGSAHPPPGAPCYNRRPADVVIRRLFMSAKTYTAKPGEIERRWHVVDAEGQTLGRLATRIADVLRGKDKPVYTPHVDTGDFVIVVNAEKIAVTGKKLDDKIYYRHSGYPGGIKQRTLREQLDRRPTEVLRVAVKGMLPRNKLAARQLVKLKIYAGPEHPHAAQDPKPLVVK